MALDAIQTRAHYSCTLGEREKSNPFGFPMHTTRRSKNKEEEEEEEEEKNNNSRLLLLCKAKLYTTNMLLTKIAREKRVAMARKGNRKREREREKTWRE